MIILEIEGKRYENFVSIEVRKSMETISGAFTFNATSNKTTQFPIKRSASARVLIDDVPVITGYVNRVAPNYDNDTHILVINGRDKTCDIVDSSLRSNIEFNTGITLKRIIEKVLSDLGITDIDVIDNVGNIKKFDKSELISGSADKNAFEFIENYCRLRQVLCTTDGGGNIVLTRGSTELLPVKLINKKNNETNNVKNGDSFFDEIGRFYRVTILSQGNPSASDDTNIVSKSGTAFDTEIRKSRNLTLIAEHSSSDFTNKERATWQVNVNRARGTGYACVVQGYKISPDNTEIWQPNKLVKIEDEFANINSQMLIRECVYRLSVDAGSETLLTLVPKDAYTVQAQLDEVQSRANLTGNDLTK
jgi:prophage tail gpP-like protein